MPVFLISACALTLFLAGCGEMNEKVLESSASPEPEKVQVSETAEESDEAAVLYVQVGDDTFAASLEDNEGAAALAAMLEQEPLTIRMRDYGEFEKVGELGAALPAEDSQMTAGPGDIMLYQGDQIVMFYGSNSWSYTRLGHIDDLEGWEQALGKGDVTVTFFLE